MGIGFQSFIPSGTVQIDSDKFTYMLKQKGTVTGSFTTGGFGGGFYVGSVTITGCVIPIMFCAMDRVVTDAVDNGGGSWTFSFASVYDTIPYALFDVGQSSGINFGLVLYNSLGQITFDSNLFPLMIVASGTENIATAVYTNLPYTGEAGRTYYNTGVGSFFNYAGSEVFPGEYEAIQNTAVMTYDTGTNQAGMSAVSIVGGTNDPGYIETPAAASYWMIADVTNF